VLGTGEQTVKNVGVGCRNFDAEGDVAGLVLLDSEGEERAARGLCLREMPGAVREPVVTGEQQDGVRAVCSGGLSKGPAEEVVELGET
jgi:hypothetical protein